MTGRIALPANILFIHIARRLNQFYMVKLTKELIECVIVNKIECQVAAYTHIILEYLTRNIGASLTTVLVTPS